ncbi:hypothetical protein [Endozoicomonas euniceicola]|uniref:Uncharacterized protein n=1 Tax=Endozoicomonas euniceicola TaxID=1234143 RepID=A0ABY6GYR2_9GAMM|nr:hypothetical protein [Endozoicomonas euniceicola]UYM17529.1 hypothetical protein NX720_06325 [Endozoicomonas euniceicola]
MTPDPSSSASRPSTQKVDLNNEPLSDAAATGDDLSEARPSDQVVEGTSIHHRSVEKSESGTAQGTTTKTPDKDALRKQLTEILNQYSDQSPAPGESPEAYQLRQEQINPYRTEAFLKKLLSESVDIQSSDYFSQAPESIRCSILLSEAMTRKRLNDHEGLSDVIERLLEQYPEPLPDIIELLSLCRGYTFTPEKPELEAASNYFYDLAAKHRFPPALWLIVRESVKPNARLFSPGLIPELLETQTSRLRDISFILGTFALQPDEADVIYRSVNDKNTTPYHQALWLLSVHLRALSNAPWPGKKDGFSTDLQGKMKFTFIVAGGVASVSSETTHSHLATDISENGQQLIDALKPLSLSRRRSALREWTGYDQLHDAEMNPELSDYQRSLVGLSLAWSIKHEYITCSGTALKCAKKMSDVAGRGVFSLLYMDAAKIYAAFGHYSEAIACLDKLLFKPLPESQKDTVINLREAYQSNLDKSLEEASEATPGNKPDNDWLKGLVPDTGTGTGTGIGKTKGKAGKKGAQKKQSRKKSHSKSMPRKSPDQTSGLQASPFDSGSKSSVWPDETLATPTPPPSGNKAVAATSKVPKGEFTPPAKNWLPDRNPAVYRFITKLNHHRHQENLKQAAAFISQSMQQNKGKPLFGRICEESAWFYIHQMDSGLNTTFTLDGDSASSSKELGKLAGNWLNQTEASYFQTMKGCDNSPEKLELLINQVYQNHPDWFADPEYAKRLVGLCSSRGHLCSNLAQQGINIRLNREKYRAFYHLKSSVEQLHLAAQTSQ